MAKCKHPPCDKDAEKGSNYCKKHGDFKSNSVRYRREPEEKSPNK